MRFDEETLARTVPYVRNKSDYTIVNATIAILRELDQ